MPKLNEWAVLERAMKLSEEDGFEWDFEFKMPLPKYSKIVLRKILKEEDRQKYLTRAREDLLNECGDRA